MLNLIFAPFADTLVSLAEKQIGQAWADPFDPPQIIVPNPAVKKWLTIKLAESQTFGCVIDAHMTTLENFLWNALGGKQGANMVNAKLLSQIVCAVLDEDLLAQKIYTPLKNYLCQTDGAIDALKRVQLSLKIAAQFIEYEYNRPSVWIDSHKNWKNGIDAQWLAQKKYFENREHEAWQMDLYCRVNECLKESDLTSLPHLYRRRREECAKSNKAWCDIGDNKQIILFGVSKISHFHRNTLVEISQIDDSVVMHVFLTNPCAEFWEDVDTARRTKTLRRKWNNNSPDADAGIKPVAPQDYEKSELREVGMFADIENDHKLLKLWGSAGKENIFLWCPLASWNFSYFTDDDLADYNNTTSDLSSNTLLKSIQKSLLDRASDLDLANVNLQNDDSVQILACPDISREIEELREKILDLAHKKQICAFNDIAVYMPDTNKYLPHIQRVFGAYPQNHPEHIPFAVLHARGTTSLVSHALATLVDIASGEYNRAKIFELLRNPIVWSSKEISPDDVDMWEEWAETFGMFRGYDAASRKRMGDMGESATDAHTFKRGMEKLFLDIGENEDDAHKESADQFMSLLEELNDLTLRFAGNDNAKKTLDIRVAISDLTNAVWAWLGSITDDGIINSASEVRIRKDALKGFEQMLLQCDLAHREKICGDEFFAHVRNSITTETSVTHSAWNGVTFAPLRAAMVLSHRVVFALGLGAADFPGVADSGSWNLLAEKRIIGDSDTVRDNRFAFLELVHAAKEKLVLSYRARNMQKDEALQPSSVIMELEEYLISQGLINIGAATRRSIVHCEIPWIVHENLHVAAKRNRAHGSWDKTERELAQLANNAQYKRVKHRIALAEHTRKQNAQNENIDSNKVSIEVDLKDIKMFLKNPLEYHLRKTLKINDGDRFGATAVCDEPLKSGDVEAAQLRKNIFYDILHCIFNENVEADCLKSAALQFADKRYLEHIESGLAPTGHACRMEQKNLAEWSQLAAPKLHELLKQFPEHKIVEEYEFSHCFKQFTIRGKYPFIIMPKNDNDKTKSIGVVSFVKSDKNAKIADNLELFTDGALQWISELGSAAPRDIIAVQLDRGDKPAIQTAQLTASRDSFEKIEKWLENILTQMFIEKRCEHLPFKTIMESTKKSSVDELTIEELKEKVENYGTFTDGFNLTDATIDDITDEKLRETVKARYAPITERWLYA